MTEEEDDGEGDVEGVRCGEAGCDCMGCNLLLRGTQNQFSSSSGAEAAGWDGVCDSG